MPKLRLKYLLALFAFIQLHAAGQLIPPDKIRSLTVDDGLPQGFITAIAQDSKGFIWISTHDGFVRYDGKNLKVFRHDAADSNSLSSNVIDHMSIDKEDHIWLQNENRQSDVFDPATGKFRHISNEKTFEWLSPKNLSEPFQITEDDAHRIYIQYFDKNTSKRKLRYFTWKSPVFAEITFQPGEYPVFMRVGKNRQLWVTTNKALYLSEDHAPLKKISALPDQLCLQSVPEAVISGDIRITGDGNILVADLVNTWQYNVRTGLWQKFKFPPDVTNVRKDVEIGPDGNYYLTSKGKLYRYNKDGALWPIWENNETNNTYLIHFIDRSNVFWAGTNTFGARLIDLNNSGFRSFKYQYTFFYDQISALNNIKIDKGLETAEDMQVMAYDERSCFDRNGDLWLINLPYEKIGNQRLTPSSLTMTSQGHAYVHTFAYDPRADVKHIVSNFTFDRQNRCWAILYDHILARADLVKNLFSDTVKIVPGNETVNYMLSINDNLCLVEPDALQFYNPHTKKSVLYKNQPDLALFRDSYLLMAAPDPVKKNVLWIATRGNGLIKFDMATGKAQALNERNGIPNNTVYAIVPDQHGFFWCSSNKGLFRFNPVDKSGLSFTKKDGLQGNEFNRFQFLSLPDGHIAFGGTEGWTIFHPDSIKVDSYKPQTEITSIQVNNIDLSDYAGWKNQEAPAINTLSLTYDMNFLTFHFAGLQFNDPEKLQYRYLLEGVDKKWVNAGNQASANYSGLAPGDYTFKVNATNTAGIWSGNIKTLHIIIHPPWWKTWWAYALYIDTIIVLAFFIFRYRLTQAKAKQQFALKQKEAEQLKAIDEMKSRFFSNITHEFRTPLSLIISPVEQMQAETADNPALKKQLNGVQRNAQQLLRLINQLLDLSKLEAGNMKLALSRGDISVFAAECVQSFKQKADIKNIKLEFNTSIEGGEYLFDAEKWEKILFNLLSNAIKFTPEKGEITVRLLAEENDGEYTAVHLHVSDTGIGISEKNQPFVFERFYQVDDSRTRRYEGTGIGLSLVKELVDLMNGSIQVKSETDKGTVFDLAIPVEKAKDQRVPEWVAQAIPDELFAAEIQSPELPLQPIDKSNLPLILVVEDNEELREFISQSLSKNYQTMIAANGIEGLRIANEELPDIIISDVMMPGMDGYRLCKKVKSDFETDHIAVILLTAKSSHESVIEGLSIGADDYITKPFHFDELQLRIRNLLNRREKLQKQFQAQLNDPGVRLNNAEIKNDFVLQLYSIIDEYLDDSSLNVERLASEVAVSHRTLNRKLSSVVGLSANELIKQYRLKKSIEFLRAGQNVSETAYSVGFETHSYFTTSFKSFFGLTPSEYIGVKEKK